MSTRRQEKLASIYQEVISLFLEREIKIEGGLFSVTTVNISDDLKALKIHFSVWPDTKEKDVIESLEKIKRELRGHLAEKVKTKFVPTLEFVLDESTKMQVEIENLLKKID